MNTRNIRVQNNLHASELLNTSVGAAGEISTAVVGKIARGLYSPFTQTIFLYRPWNSSNPLDQSVLLHELEHHRQHGHGHWYCPGAQELPAYRLQQKWLSERSLELDVNWVEIVLISAAPDAIFTRKQIPSCERPDSGEDHRSSQALLVLGLRVHTDVQLAQLCGGNIGRCAHQQVLGLLVHREHDDFAQVSAPAAA